MGWEGQLVVRQKKKHMSQLKADDTRRTRKHVTQKALGRLMNQRTWDHIWTKRAEQNGWPVKCKRRHKSEAYHKTQHFFMNRERNLPTCKAGERDKARKKQFSNQKIGKVGIRCSKPTRRTSICVQHKWEETEARTHEGQVQRFCVAKHRHDNCCQRKRMKMERGHELWETVAG